MIRELVLFGATLFVWVVVSFRLKPMRPIRPGKVIRRIAIIILLVAPFHIGDNLVFTVLGTAQSQGNIVCLFSPYARASKSVYSLIGGGWLEAGEDVVSLTGIGVVEKAGRDAVHGVGLSFYQQGGRDVIVDLGVGGVQRGERAVLLVGAGLAQVAQREARAGLGCAIIQKTKGGQRVFGIFSILPS